MISPLHQAWRVSYSTGVAPSEYNLSDEFACPVPHDHVVHSLWRLILIKSTATTAATSHKNGLNPVQSRSCLDASTAMRKSSDEHYQVALTTERILGRNNA